MYKKVEDGVYDLGVIHDTRIVCNFNREIILLSYLRYEKTEYVSINDISHHYFSRRFWYEHWRAFLRTAEGDAAYNKMIEKRNEDLSYVS